MLDQNYSHLHILDYIGIYPVTYNKISDTIRVRHKFMTVPEFISISLRAQTEIMFDATVSNINIHKYRDNISFNCLCISTLKLETIKTKLLNLTT